MRSVLYPVIAGLICQAVLCDFVSYMKDEFNSAEPALDAKAAEKELLSIPLDDERLTEKKDVKKDSTVEAQLKDLLDAVNKEKKSNEKKEQEDKDLFAVFKTFEESDAADKDNLLNKMEEIIKKEVLSSKKEVLSSDVAEEDSAGLCRDYRRDCLKLARNGYCGTHENEMRRKCAKTCRYCVECVNKLPDKSCRAYEKYGYCAKHTLRMKKLCLKECGYCSRPPPTQTKCAKAKYGCCWDKFTVKLDKVGSNCPSCKDRNKVLCDRFSRFCFKSNKAGSFMRNFCPEKCGICDMKCTDDFGYKDKCPTWKQLGWCSSVKQAMKALCQKTCKYC